jgi:enamine deaminase RidA (YjgF/YER057c/UK114 family)
MHAREAVIRSDATYEEWHFAEATRVGDMVWVSGQRGYDAYDLISDDPAEQARVALRNLAEVLRRAGASVADIVDLTSYHVNMADVPSFRAAKDELIKPPYPSWTVIGVRELATPQMKVEVKAIAVVGSGAAARVRD